MAKPTPKLPNETMSITIPGDLAHELTAQADARVLSRSFLVERFIREGLPRLPEIPTASIPAEGSPLNLSGG